MSLTLFMGCMFSGKTTRLIQEHQRWKSIKKKTLVINHRFDAGSDNMMANHDSIQIPCIKSGHLSEISDDLINPVDAIFINEGQFYPDLKSKCLEWCETKNKHVFVAGLDGDRHRGMFGQMLELIPFANYYEKLLARCGYCLDGTTASFTHSNQSNNSQVYLGSEQYVPVCRRHYLVEHAAGEHAPP